MVKHYVGEGEVLAAWIVEIVWDLWIVVVIGVDSDGVWSILVWSLELVGCRGDGDPSCEK